MNHVTLTGNACAEPVLAHDQRSVARTTLRIAVASRQGHPSTATFLNVVCWRGLAENVASSVRMGDHVTVTGWLNTERYTDEGGETRYFTEVVASDVALSLAWAAGTLMRVSEVPSIERSA